jgi:hypothetical protein
VNRLGLIDSSNAGKLAGRDLQMLVLERRDANRNMAHFYVLAIEPTLFGATALVREWGRRRRLDLRANPEMAVEALEVWLVRKGRCGDRIRV